MFDATDFLKLIKKTSMDAFVASKPTDIVFGKVISTSPLKIKVDQKLILSSAQLVLSRNVTEYTVEMTVDHVTEIDTSHNHAYKGRKKFKIHNALERNEEVIMVQISGGQKYIVIDRIGKV